MTTSARVSDTTVVERITNVADGDLVYIVDVSDTTDHADGSSKAITAQNLVTNYVAANLTIDHGALTGLTDDDHSIYSLLAGRSGGQTLTGGTASGEDLVFISTSNATKGTVAIDATGGAFTAEGTCHIHTASSGSLTASTNADDLIVENSAEGGISILVPEANYGNILFGNPTDGNADGRVRYDNNNRALEFWSASLQAVHIDSSQRVGIATTSPNSTIHVDGSWAVGIQSTAVSANTTGKATVHVTDTSATRTITIDSDEVAAGRRITIVDTGGQAGSNSITVATEGSETINGGSTATINANFGSITLESNGTNWFIIAKTF